MSKSYIDLSGQVAIVTAGANGLGEGCARSLAKNGASVVIADVDVDKGLRLADELRTSGAEVLFVETNMLVVDEINEMVRRTGETFGRIDIVVNNAGGISWRLFKDSFERSWRKHIDMNYVSTIATTYEALKWMIPAGRGGSIVNVSSVEGLRGCPGLAVYAGCKAAVIGFTKSLAAELGEHAIRVNALAPDICESPGVRSMLPDTPEAQAALERYVPLKRLGRAEEVGDIVAFLSSSLGAYITGTTQVIDGGSMAASGFQRTRDGSGWEVLQMS